MTAKEYLEQIKQIEVRIKTISDEIVEIRSLLGVQAINYDRVGYSPNVGDTDKVLKLILKLIDKQNDLVDEYFKLSEKRAEIRETMFLISNPTQIEVVYRRYFLHQSWATIADEMHYVRPYVFELHKKALDKLDEILSTD